MSLPTLRALRRRFPEDSLTVLARRGPAAVYRAEGSADQVLPRGSFLGDVASVRGGRFDEAWLLPNSMRAALTAFLAGVDRRLGYATDRRGRAADRPAAAAAGHEAPAARLRRAALPRRSPARHGAAEPARFRPRRRGARGRRSRRRGSRRGPSCSVPAARSAATKRWPAERFAALAGALGSRGAPCAVAIGPSERELGEAVARAAGSALPVLGADLDPVELAAVFARARAVVSNDSGPTHLAAAVGTPVVVFFGADGSGPHRRRRARRRASSTATCSARPASWSSARTGTSA